MHEFNAACVYIVGDINFDQTNWLSMTSTTPDEQLVLDDLTEHNYQQLIKCENGRSLDIILCNKPQTALNVAVDNQMRILHTSDHQPYSAKISLQAPPNHKHTPLPKRKLDFSLFAFKKANWKEINEFIKDHPFNPYCFSNPDQMVEKWYEWLYEVLEDLVPRKTKHRRELAPWVLPESSNLIKKLQTLQRKQETRPTNENERKIEKVQTNLMTSLQKDQHSYETQLFQSGRFSEIQKYLKTLTKANHIPQEVFLDDKIARTDAEKAELFNQYFQSVFTEQTYTAEKHVAQPTPVIDSIHFTQVEIKEAMSNLEVNKAKGPDSLGNEVLKNLSESLCKSLCMLFNLIANKGHFPNEWKMSEIVPMFKDGNKQEVANYRPISLLSTVSKLLEKLIFNKLYPIVSPLLSESQHGFRSKKSTLTNLIEFLHHLFINVDSSDCDFLMVFYIDFKKAFDKVNHERLIEKLSSLGIGEACLKLLISYLKDRKQTVRINGTISTVLSVISGVPQGSVLGPLLFLVFINDLPDCSMSDSFGYADDFKIVGTNPVAINIDIRRIWKWCQSNLMEINLSKSKCLWLKGDGTVCLPNFSFESTPVMKDLGVVVADTLSWATHSQFRTQKALNALYSIKRNLSLANYANRKNSYVSYVVPIISYGSSVWKPGKVELSLIESVQKKAANWITGAKFPYKEQLLKLNLLPLSLYHELHVVLLFAKILTGKVDLNWKLHVSITEPGTTRYQTTRNFICQQPKLRKCESDYWYRACYLANTFNEFFKYDILFHENHKVKLLDLYFVYFKLRYDENNTCSWRIMCGCNNCKNVKKLNFCYLN